MKRFYRFPLAIASVAILFLPSMAKAQKQVVFSDNFNQPVSNPIVTSGNPLVTYTVWTNVIIPNGEIDGQPDHSADPQGGTVKIETYNMDDNMMRLYPRHRDSEFTYEGANRTQVSALLSDYDAAFKPVVSENTGMVEWIFTAKQFRTSGGGTSGYNGSNTGMAVVLLADGNEWAQAETGSNGYAVSILKPDGANYSVGLVRFADGFKNGSYTVLAGNMVENKLSSLNTWFTVRVTYNPGNDEWKLYFRDEVSESEKGDVSDEGGLALIGSVVDATYTKDVTMTYFGALVNGPAPGLTGAAANSLAMDDYSVSVVSTSTSLSNSGVVETAVFPNPTSGIVTLSLDQSGNARYSVMDLTGRVILDGAFADKVEIDLSVFGQSIYLVRVESASGVSLHKVLVK